MRVYMDMLTAVAGQMVQSSVDCKMSKVSQIVLGYCNLVERLLYVLSTILIYLFVL